MATKDKCRPTPRMMRDALFERRPFSAIISSGRVPGLPTGDRPQAGDCGWLARGPSMRRGLPRGGGCRIVSPGALPNRRGGCISSWRVGIQAQEKVLDEDEICNSGSGFAIGAAHRSLAIAARWAAGAPREIPEKGQPRIKKRFGCAVLPDADRCRAPMDGDDPSSGCV